MLPSVQILQGFGDQNPMGLCNTGDYKATAVLVMSLTKACKSVQQAPLNLGAIQLKQLPNVRHF